MNAEKTDRTLVELCPGVWKLTLGCPERMTPTTLFSPEPDAAGLERLPKVEKCPIGPGLIAGEVTPRGYLVRLPLADDEQIYGLGLQLLSLNQRGKKKTLRVNSDPIADLGDSHAPVPFYVTTQGYGVLVDTLRYMTIYCGSAKRRTPSPQSSPPGEGVAAEAAGSEELYAAQARSGDRDIVVEVPGANGVDLYLFAGPDMQQAVQRYNLFSGGGCLPPLWGLGVWYRCKSSFDQASVLSLSDRFREKKIPCDVIGLEPGWQTKAYSCSFVWSDRFPQPKEMLYELTGKRFHLNLWEHAFTHPSSPLHEALRDHSGDHLVWDGLVPDFAEAEAREAFAEFHKKTHVDLGVSGYKLDECDNSDFIKSKWSFPEFSRFPSGLDGEQMHAALGSLYMRTILGIFKEMGWRTYCQVRSGWALAASLPFVLYSDLYDHRSFIRGVAVSGFSGLLWSPEVRHAESMEDLVRRVQCVMFSPQAVVNGWYIKNPPWEQWNRNANNAGELHPDRERATELCRQAFELRMQFLPYLYSAYVEYHHRGVPPFRALVMEDPSDSNLWNIDSAYMMGDRVLVAPVVAGITDFDLYLPKGGWRDFWTGARYEGGQSHHFEAPLERIALFVKDNSILPLAEPAQHASDPALRRLTVRVYGSGELGCALYEDDGETNAHDSGEFNTVTLTWDRISRAASLTRDGNTEAPAYEILNTWVR